MTFEITIEDLNEPISGNCCICETPNATRRQNRNVLTLNRTDRNGFLCAEHGNWCNTCSKKEYEVKLLNGGLHCENCGCTETHPNNPNEICGKTAGHKNAHRSVNLEW